MCLTRTAIEFDFRIDRREEVFVFELSHGGFGHALVAAQLAANFVEIVGG